MYHIHDMFYLMQNFMAMGGAVLWLIAGLTVGLWCLISERLWYFHVILPAQVVTTLQYWESRPERKSWHAQQLRRALIARNHLQMQRFLKLIHALVAISLLLGLLGTVTGMLEVFNIMALTGGADARSLAGGVSRATIPTMAGMVAALAGMFANNYLQRIANRERKLLEEHMTTEH